MMFMIVGDDDGWDDIECVGKEVIAEAWLFTLAECEDKMTEWIKEYKLRRANERNGIASIT